MSDFHDRAGEPLELLEWGRRRADPEYTSVAFDELPDGRVVSTFKTNSLRIFETMVFGPNPERQLLDGPFRYATESLALAGHRHVLAKARLAPELGE